MLRKAGSALALASLLGPSAVAEASAGSTASRSSRNVTVTLVPELNGLEPGKPFWVGLHLKLAPAWHTYWKNPGDAGLPTRIEWRLPPGYAAGDIEWPRPERFAGGPLTSYGYAQESLLLTEIRPAAAATGAVVEIGARVAWLECKEACLPGRADLVIALPIVSGPAPPLADWAPTFRRFRERLPRTHPRLEVEAVAAGRELSLAFRGVRAPRQAYFFAAQPEVVEHGAAQRLVSDPSGFRLLLTRAVNAPVPPRIEGVLEADGEAYQIQAVVGSNRQAGRWEVSR